MNELKQIESTPNGFDELDALFDGIIQILNEILLIWVNMTIMTFFLILNHVLQTINFIQNKFSIRISFFYFI